MVSLWHGSLNDTGRGLKICHRFTFLLFACWHNRPVTMRTVDTRDGLYKVQLLLFEPLLIIVTK